VKRFLPLAILFVLCAAPSARAQAGGGSASHADGDDSKKSVVITGGLSGSEVATDSAVLFWVTIDNRTTSKISGLSVQLEVDKEEFGVSCRLPGAAEDSKGCGSTTVEVAADQSITIQGKILALRGTEARNIVAVVDYDSAITSGAAAAHSRRALALGPLVAKSEPHQLYDNFKDLILPIVLAIVGYLITKGQEDRAQIAQTWSNMLPISHKMATQYYTPMMASAQRVILDADKFEKPLDDAGNPNGDALSFYFHFLLTWRRYDRTIAEKGGIYFKSRMGERLFLTAIDKIRRAHKGETTADKKVTDALKKDRARERELRVKAIFRRMPHEMDIAQFTAVWEQPVATRREISKAFHAAWDDFLSWYREEGVRKDVLKYFNAFLVILDYETNRPYNKWYNSQEKLVLEPEVKETLESFMTKDEDRAELQVYLEKARDGETG
jgi:hypothetical protein